MTGVQLRAKVFPLGFALYLFKPQVSINGAPPFSAQWGENEIPLHAGRYRIDCWYNYLFGPANRGSIVVDVPAHGTVRLVYRTRWMVFLPGKLAVEPTTGGGAPQVAGAPLLAPPTLASAPPAGWLADPTSRHELRYWDGQRWTEHVSTRGAAGVDPLA